MTPIGGTEALERLKALLAGEVIVEEEVMPRLVQALVRLSGTSGQELFAFHLMTSRVSHMAARLAQMSVMVLGAKAVPALVEGALTTVDLPRIRATAEVLAKLGTLEAHGALGEIARRVRHPVGKEMAATKMEELERDHPTRFALLPRLKKLSDEEPEKLFSDFLAVEDREAALILLEELPALNETARALAYRIIGEKGDLNSARLLQNKLLDGEQGDLLGHFAAALGAIIRRLPQVVEDFISEWRSFYTIHKDNREPALAAAQALVANPSPALADAYVNFLGSQFAEVRLLGYKGLTLAGKSGHVGEVSKGLLSTSLEEVAAAAATLCSMGNPAPLEELAKAKSAQRRAIAAGACLEVGRPDLWASLALDEERSVRAVAIKALDLIGSDKVPSAEMLAPIISFTVDYDSFEALCSTLCSLGDLESAKRLAARLSEKDERITSSVLKVLKALRLRGVFTLEALGEGKNLLLATLLNSLSGKDSVSLIGACVEDFDLTSLETLRNALLAQPPSVKQGPAQAVTLAIIGRIHLLGTRKKIIEEIEKAIGGHPATAREQIEYVNRVASLWLRGDLELGQAISERIENWMMTVAHDKTLARIARKAAVEAVGKAGSAKVLPSLLRLRQSPTEEISNSADSAAQTMARRFPMANMSAPADENLRRQALLVVEDDPNIRNIFQTFLFQRGYAAYGAAEGEEALGMMATAHVDAVLLDLHMPGMDGFGFLEALMKVRNAPPVVVITSYGDRNTVLRVLKLGAVEFLRKPVDLPEMLARVRKAIGGRSFNS